MIYKDECKVCGSIEMVCLLDGCLICEDCKLDLLRLSREKGFAAGDRLTVNRYIELKEKQTLKSNGGKHE